MTIQAQIKATFDYIKTEKFEKEACDNAQAFLSVIEVFQRGYDFCSNRLQEIQRTPWDQVNHEERAELLNLLGVCDGGYREALEGTDAAISFGFYSWADGCAFSDWAADHNGGNLEDWSRAQILETERANIIDCFWDRLNQ